MSSAVQYLFIDGDYFRKVCSDIMLPVFEVEPEIDFRLMRQSLNCQKAFYYACVDDVRRPGENDAALQARVEAQEQTYERIQAEPGLHVRLGTLVGGRPKRLRQKEVDVQLAVDMLSHGFAKNMASAVLLTGDLDFRPVVRALMQFGTYVRLCFAPGSVAKDLLRAADEGLELSLELVHEWTTAAFRSQHPLPAVQQFAVPPDKVFAQKRGAVHRRGHIGSSSVEIWFTEADQLYHVITSSERGSYLCFTHSDVSFLERFMKCKHGEILWT